MAATSEIFALVGVIVGAGTSFGVSTLGERIKYKRELNIRWDTSKRDAYLEYVVAVVQMARAAGQIAGSRGWDGIAVPAVGEQALQMLDQAEIDRTKKFESVVLLGHEDCIKAAHELNRRVWHMEWLVRGVENCTLKIWQEALDGYVHALTNFHAKARQSLIISGAPLEERIVERPHDQPEPTPGSQRSETTDHNSR